MLSSFIIHLREVFGHSMTDSSVSVQLYHLHQGKFLLLIMPLRTLAASSGCNELSLLTTCRQGLEPTLRLHLCVYDDSMGLERIRVAVRMRTIKNCSPPHPRTSQFNLVLQNQVAIPVVVLHFWGP